MRLQDKAAIVTGGGSGLGRAACELFAEQGAKVVVADINVEGGKETVALIEKKEAARSLWRRMYPVKTRRKRWLIPLSGSLRYEYF